MNLSTKYSFNKIFLTANTLFSKLLKQKVISINAFELLLLIQLHGTSEILL